MPDSDPAAAIRTPSGVPSGCGETPEGVPPFPVPDHTLIRRIGRGAYGEVWLARNAIGTWRAVKFVRRSSFDDDRPFEREFAGIQRFEPVSRSHESQLNILQVGRVEGGFYYVMELADSGRSQEPEVRSQKKNSDGNATEILNSDSCLLTPVSYSPRTLRSELHLRGRLPAAECLRIGLALTTALEHLHKHGLVHRDIKPSNIVFVNGIPKLADIGLVARAEATVSFVGTEGFLPPEGPGTRQADIYSLGKVLYEISTGHDRNQFPELPTNIIELPDRAALSELNEVLLKACHRDPAERYQTAAEMHADLALLESGRSVARLRGIERRLELAQRGGVIVLLLAAVIGLGWWWQARQTRLVRELAIEKTKLAGENRLRLARLHIANGTRLLDEGDPAGALLWHAEALPLLTPGSAEESVHRIRIHETMRGIPSVRHVFPHANEGLISAFSEDGRRVATGTDWGFLSVWDARTGAPLWASKELEVERVGAVQFTRDGRFVFASSLRGVGFVSEARPTNSAALFEVETGRQALSLTATNLLRASLSPNDRWLVTADTAHVIQVRDVQDGKVISQFKGHTGKIVEFQFNADASVLASSSLDRSVRLWRLPNGEPLGAPIPYEPEQGPFALNQGGLLIATVEMKITGTTNSILRVWNTATGAAGEEPLEIPGAIESVWFPPQAPDDLFIMTSQQSVLLDPKTREVLARLANPRPDFYLFSVSADGRRIAFGSREGVAGVWELATGEQLMPACLRGFPITDLNFSPDGFQLLIQTSAGTAMILPVSRMAREDALARFDGAVSGSSPTAFLEWRRFTPDRRYFLLILANGAVRRVDFARLIAEPLPEDTVEGVFAPQVTFDSSGRRGALYFPGNRAAVVKMWSETDGVTNHFTLPLPAGLNEQFRFTIDGSRLLLPCGDGKLRIWKTADGTLERTVEIKSRDGKSIPFPDGRSAFVLLTERGSGLLDLSTGVAAKTPLPPFNITAFRFDPAGERWASAGEVTWSRIWSTRACEPLTPPLNHGAVVQCVDWSPDGSRVITVGQSPELKVWDASTGEQILSPLRLGNKPLVVGQWSLDGRLIVARSDENTVRVWDSATGEPVTPVILHDSYVRLAQIVMTNRLVTLSLPNVIRAWDLAETRLTADVIADYARLVSGRRINAAGVAVPISAAELARLCQSLRERAPELFR